VTQTFRKIGVCSRHAHRTTPTGSVRDTSTAFLLTYIMSQCMCCSTKRRRVTGSCGGGIGFVLVVLSLSAATCGPHIAVARLTSAAMTVQFRKEPAFKAAMSLLSGGNPRLAWSRRASALLSTSRFEYSDSLAETVGSFVSKSVVASCLLAVATLTLENLLVGAPICRGSGLVSILQM
jgi:hypothetical protein